MALAKFWSILLSDPYKEKEPKILKNAPKILLNWYKLK